MKCWLILCAILACCCGPCCPCDDCDAAVNFNWSPPAKHHEAVVAVQAGSRGGSGVYIVSDGVYMVLTCQHVAIGGSPMTAKFRDGTTRSGQARTDKDGHDIAGMIITPHPTVEPLKISEHAPARGRVEMLGYAGPAGRLRHWWGNWTQTDLIVNQYDAGVGSGDSGGPVLSERREVIGLLAHGMEPNDTDGWATYNRAGGPAWTPLRNFAIRLRAFSNPSGTNPPLNQRPAQGGCPGGTCPIQPRQSPYGGGLYPPDYQLSPPIQPAQPTPAQPGCQCPDYSERFIAIDNRLKAMEQQKSPSAEAIAEILVRNYADKIRGPKGDKGDPGSDGSNAVPRETVTHATLVVDRSASYWPRLSVALERARERFHGIRIAAPPEFATELPAIVFYKNGKPVLVRKGERDVTHTLTALERGDLSFLQES